MLLIFLLMLNWQGCNLGDPHCISPADGLCPASAPPLAHINAIKLCYTDNLLSLAVCLDYSIKVHSMLNSLVNR